MTRPAHFKEYEDMPEIVPGVFVLPGDGVYIVDDEGEVACWVASEWEADPEAVTATVNACILAATLGASAVRRNIADRSETINRLRDQTAQKVRKL